MSNGIEALRERAALRSMSVRKAEERGAWELYSPYRVVCVGSLDNVADWLTAAEERDGRAVAVPALGSRADF
ncbi:hypothetical protein [Nocardia salmonicida]|uniref:hypothetical protein n=1 Tax=Nocardia salmonicida TaxID=53431 RepID=UPI003799740E